MPIFIDYKIFYNVFEPNIITNLFDKANILSTLVYYSILNTVPCAIQ